MSAAETSSLSASGSRKTPNVVVAFRETGQVAVELVGQRRDREHGQGYEVALGEPAEERHHEHGDQEYAPD